MSEAAEVLPDVPPLPQIVPPEPRTNGKGGRSRFTKETAKIFSSRGHEARRRNKQLRADAAKVASDAFPPVVATERLAMVLSQIARTHATLKRKLEARDRAQLLLAFDRLLERERILRGIPLPGSRRPGRERPSSGQQSGTQGPLD